MHTYNIGYSGDTEAITTRLTDISAPSTDVVVLSSIRVARITTELSLDDILAIPGVSFAEEDISVMVEKLSSWHLRRLGTQFLPIPMHTPKNNGGDGATIYMLSLIHISEPTRRHHVSRMPSSA